jgi:hypothetical protein
VTGGAVGEAKRMITDNQRLVGIVGATNRGNKEKPMRARGVVAVI